MIGIINKLRIRKNTEAVVQQINWIHEELTSACDCNDIAELKKKLHVLAGRKLDEEEVISKEKIDKLYKLIMEIEAQENT